MNNEVKNRLEITMSQAIEEDFINSFLAKDTGKMFTKIPVVMGQGNSEPKMGDAIWPQLNCMYIVICSDKEEKVIVDIIQSLHKMYPKEGLFCTKSTVEVLV